MSLKMVPFESLGTVSYSSSIVTIVLYCIITEMAKLSEADKSLQLPDGLVRSSTTVKNLGVTCD